MLIKSLAPPSSHIRKQAQNSSRPIEREPLTACSFPYRSFGGFEIQEQEQKLKSI